MNIPSFKSLKSKADRKRKLQDKRLIEEFCGHLTGYLSATYNVSVRCDLKYIMYTEQVKYIFKKKGWNISFEYRDYSGEIYGMTAYIKGIE